MNNIYSPKNIEEAKNLCELLANDRYNPQQLLTLHANFGHHFDGNIAITAQQAYLLKGKPSLSADAMHAIARKSGLVRFIRVTSLDHTHCTYEMSRIDEPVDVVHVWTFTMQMADHQGLTRNRNWQQMPMQMLRARALTFGLRGTFPEAVSGIYSADEIADNQSMNDDERAELSAEVLGEDIEKVQKKTKVNMSTGEIVEPPKPTPIFTMPNEVIETPAAAPEQAQAQVKTYGYNFDTVDGFWAACKHKKLTEKQVKHAILVQEIELEKLNPAGLSEAFYLKCCTPTFLHSNRLYPPKDPAEQSILMARLRSYAGISFFRDLQEDYKAITSRLSDAAWHESLLLLKGKSGNYKSNMSQSAIDRANEILKHMKPGDWSQYDRIQAMIKDPSSFDDSSNVQAESIPF